VTREVLDWENVIIECLSKESIGTNYWGCLNKNGKLFRISTLRSVQVPKKVLSKMEKDGELSIDDEGYFVYNGPKRQVKRTRRVI